MLSLMKANVPSTFIVCLSADRPLYHLTAQESLKNVCRARFNQPVLAS